MQISPGLYGTRGGGLAIVSPSCRFCRTSATRTYRACLCQRPEIYLFFHCPRFPLASSQLQVNCLPQLNGQPIDLLNLYNQVALRGGYKRVTLGHQWPEVAASLNLPLACVNSGYGIRIIYQRHLEQYERMQRISEGTYSSYGDGSNDASLFEMESLDPLIQNRTPTKVPAASLTKASCVLHPKELHEPNAKTNPARTCYSGLEFALASGLPNEIDFSLNTILLMSFNPKGIMLCKNPRIIDLLLSSVGICGL
ncbi:unnamed protein product, partial [Protopolystoma xenopodis]